MTIDINETAYYADIRIHFSYIKDIKDNPILDDFTKFMKASVYLIENNIILKNLDIFNLPESINISGFEHSGNGKKYYVIQEI